MASENDRSDRCSDSSDRSSANRNEKVMSEAFGDIPGPKWLARREPRRAPPV